MRYIAFVTKGLEQVVIHELNLRLDDVEIVEVGDKRVLFDSSQPLEALAKLRTVDDLCLFVTKVEPVQDLDSLLSTCNSINFLPYRAMVKEYRVLEDHFSITTTMVGVKNFTASQLVEVLSDDVSRRYSWSYTKLDHSNFDLRVFIDRTEAYISIRLTAQSLMHRSYKIHSKPGSLRPTVAAAMVYLATQYRKRLSIVDDFCGSGTILCEAVAMGYTVYGGDIDPESVNITLSNLRNVGFHADSQIRVLDARKTRWPDSFFDCAISNLPWGKQVDLRSITSLFEGSIKEYARIVKKGAVICTLTPRPEPLVKYAKKYMKGCHVTTVPVSFTGQSPTIVMIERQ